jgi:hypothetical protein
MLQFDVIISHTTGKAGQSIPIMTLKNFLHVLHVRIRGQLVGLQELLL